MRDTSERFPWGKIVTEHEVGPYHIVEYKAWLPGRTKLVAPVRLQAREVEDKLSYHVFVNGKDTGTGAVTLEGALIVAVAHKTLGPHNPGLPMIYRALKIEGES